MQERGNKLLKLFDFYAGVPLTFLLGKVRRRAPGVPDLGNARSPRFTLVKTAGIGDTVILSAVIGKIRQEYPEAVITLICADNNKAAVTLLSGIDQVLTFRMKAPVRSLREVAQLPRQDIVLDFGPWARINSLIAFFTPARFKVGFNRKGQYRHYIYDKPVIHRDDVHEADNYWNLLRAIGFGARDREPAIQATAGDMPVLSGAVVILHPFPAGRGKELKEWPVERWAELGGFFCANGFQVAVSGGRDDAPAAELCKDKIVQAGGQALNLAGKYTLVEMCDILRQARLLVTVNTGIMHLGAAVGTPLVALHGPTSVRRWGPLGERVENITPASTCAPCLSLGFEYGCTEGGCMETITVEQVKEAALRLLKTDP